MSSAKTLSQRLCVADNARVLNITNRSLEFDRQLTNPHENFLKVVLTFFVNDDLQQVVQLTDTPIFAVFGKMSVNLNKTLKD